MEELEIVLRTNKSKSPGPDGIPYVFIQNLLLNSIKHLLDIFNTIWNNNLFPKYWRHEFVTPILKSNKNKYLTKSYSPITLLSTLCKLLEKIISPRLVWFLEKIKYISPEQNGFRKNRSILNNLLSIKNEIEISKKNKQSFLLAINYISKHIPKPIIPMLYAADFSMLCRSSILITIKQILQDATIELIVVKYIRV